MVHHREEILSEKLSVWQFFQLGDVTDPMSNTMHMPLGDSRCRLKRRRNN